MSNKKRVMLLYGGKSGEHEISLRSAFSVYKCMDRAHYECIPVGIDKNGLFFCNDFTHTTFSEASLPVKSNTSEPLPSLINHGKLSIDCDVVMPIIHGPLYEDGALQGLLELADCAYVGSDVMSSAIGMDKSIARVIASSLDIPVTPYLTFSQIAPLMALDAFVNHAIDCFGFPMFVKPTSMGSSVGVSKVHTPNDLVLAIENALQYDTEIIVEKGISGREIEFAVLQTKQLEDEPLVSVPGEIVVNHKDGYYSYQAKYIDEDKTELIVPANLPDFLVKELQSAATSLFTKLKCRGLARVDFFVDDASNQFFFNEINTIPGFTSISMYPKLWQESGINYPSLITHLIDNALMHYAQKKKLQTHYKLV